MKLVDNKFSITLFQYSTVYNISRTITVSANATAISVLHPKSRLCRTVDTETELESNRSVTEL